MRMDQQLPPCPICGGKNWNEEMTCGDCGSLREELFDEDWRGTLYPKRGRGQ